MKKNSEEVAQLAKRGFKQAFGKEMIIDKDNEKVFNLLCWYFARDERFTQAGYDLKKGIFLRGFIGTGKTSMMRAFSSSNPLQMFAVVPTSMVTDFYERGGMEGDYDKWIDGVKQLLAEPAYYAHNTSTNPGVGICFDDLGVEPHNVKHYGSTRPLMETILQERYNEFIEGYLYRTHLTSNITAKTLEDVYGERVRSRIVDMFNIIAFESEVDRRREWK